MIFFYSRKMCEWKNIDIVEEKEQDNNKDVG